MEAGGKWRRNNLGERKICAAVERPIKEMDKSEARDII
jgi:hypothetical protein